MPCCRRVPARPRTRPRARRAGGHAQGAGAAAPSAHQACRILVTINQTLTPSAISASRHQFRTGRLHGCGLKLNCRQIQTLAARYPVCRAFLEGRRKLQHVGARHSKPSRRSTRAGQGRPSCVTWLRASQGMKANGSPRPRMRASSSWPSNWPTGARQNSVRSYARQGTSRRNGRSLLWRRAGPRCVASPM